MTQRRKSKTKDVQGRFGRRAFLCGAGAAVCAGAGLWLRHRQQAEPPPESGGRSG